MTRQKPSIHSHRKDEHVFLAEKFYQSQDYNDFDEIRFVHQSLPEIDINEVSIATTFGQQNWDCPFYINAMTGGSQQTGKINGQLAQIAQIANLPMATGSQSVAIKEPSLSDSFRIVRQYNHDGFVIGNIGAGNSLKTAQEAVKMLQANALEVHLNAAQEIVMPEGDRSFKWLDGLKDIVTNLSVPVIVKEVGFGMSRETIQQLDEIGVQAIDVSGRGGTNFVTIENERRSDKAYDYLSDWGQSTVESLLEATACQPNAQILASGGIRTPLDIVKALRLGADAVGISGEILHYLIKNGPTKTTALLIGWQEQIQAIFALLGAHNIQELRQKPIILSPELRHYCAERHL